MDIAYARITVSLQAPGKSVVKGNGLLFRKSDNFLTLVTITFVLPLSNAFTTPTLSYIQELIGLPSALRNGIIGPCWIQTSVNHSNIRKNSQMIPIPIDESWSAVSMDFITGLPNSNSIGADCFAQAPKYHAHNRTEDVQQTAYHFIDCVVRYHGLPSIITIDRNFRFISKF
ncbi:LOW QUALITY PROTEIN: Gag-pol fusion protein [Phytophthora palmivora]|uniref:Gag-pol fusion protein n=1 Tax=Phytophthora palmivora TaxID=4796 RepID=A0A2P4X776_9STRA|nr:LOW QUALITY PROTEIN: Gag-pol fusion protein [Phytophthora palmivora]